MIRVLLSRMLPPPVGIKRQIPHAHTFCTASKSTSIMLQNRTTHCCAVLLPYYNSCCCYCPMSHVSPAALSIGTFVRAVQCERRLHVSRRYRRHLSSERRGRRKQYRDAHRLECYCHCARHGATSSERRQTTGVAEREASIAGDGDKPSPNQNPSLSSMSVASGVNPAVTCWPRPACQ